MIRTLCISRGICSPQKNFTFAIMFTPFHFICFLIQIYCEPDNIITSSNMALIAVVGRGMIHTKGVSARLFTALAQAGINIRMISQGSSELNIIIGVENSDFEKSIDAIYQAFA